MNVYYISRFGWMIVASDKVEALSLLNTELKKRGLHTLSFRDCNPKDFVKIDTTTPHVVNPKW